MGFDIHELLPQHARVVKHDITAHGERAVVAMVGAADAEEDELEEAHCFRCLARSWLRLG